MATTQANSGRAAGTNGHADQTATPPMRFTVEEITALLAYEACWAENTPAASTQLALYQREDGTYGCAIKDCDECGRPHRKADTMAVFGPFVLGRKHAHEVLRFGRDRLGITDESWGYTLLYSAMGHTAAFEAVEGRRDKRLVEASVEMTNRLDRLVEALVEARVRMREREEAEIAARRAAHERVPTPAEPIVSEDMIPTVEFYAGLNDEELEAAYQVASELTELLAQELQRGRIDQVEYDRQMAEQRVAVERMKEARTGKAVSAIEALKAKMGFRVPSAAPEPSAAQRPDPFGRNPLPIGRPVARVIGHMVPHTSAAPAPAERGALMAACNVTEALTGNPNEGVDAVPRFPVRAKDALAMFPTFGACDRALGEIGETWFRLLQDHAPEVKARDLRDNNKAKKAAADKAKVCLLHGPLFRAVSLYRNRVMEYYQAKFPKAWEERCKRIAAMKTREAAPSKEKCEICGGLGGSKEWKGKQVCTACKNKATLPRREANAVARSGVEGTDAKLRRAMRGAGKGGGGKKGRR